MKSILLIISGSVAAYKSLEFIRLCQKQGIAVQAILTKGGSQFITPLAVSALTGTHTYTDLFSLTDEVEMGHIQLSRKHDAVVVAPASADILARMAAGLADDLATTALLATNKPVFVVPAMNVQMWHHPATQRNLRQLRGDGIYIIDPDEGEMACGEVGAGRMAEPEAILAGIRHWASGIGKIHPTAQGEARLVTPKRSEGGSGAQIKIIITAGPTHEPIDPVRYIGNHSSGKQGIAIAEALAARGAEVHLVLGPTSEPVSATVTLHRVTTAQEMLEKCESLLPAKVAICTAAVADWGVAEPAEQKLKKRDSGEAPKLVLKENPDILATLANRKKHRPKLVIGFAAETEKLDINARAKLARKGCDWLLANDVSDGKVFGAADTDVRFYSDSHKAEHWQGTKREIAEKLAEKVLAHII
jgi:phosphopantothenoylcysteine decarboxylase/phosphopantothenate--cysteine ligase